MEEKRGGGMSAEEREKFLRIAKEWHGGGVEKPEIYHQKLVDNFKRAAAYVGFNESTTSLPPSNYPQDAMLMLYGLYKQVPESNSMPLFACSFRLILFCRLYIYLLNHQP